jgi:hypothetical protein
MDCEFTDGPRNVKQKKLPCKKRQRTTILQLCMAYKCLFFWIYGEYQGS